MTPPMINGDFMILGGENYGLCLQKRVHEENGFDPSFSPCLMAAKREIERQKVVTFSILQRQNERYTTLTLNTKEDREKDS